eukprot:scaffold11639_cov112-Isochrysis_galbana.AAC.2
MLTHTTHQITHKPTPPRSLPPQKGKGKAPPPPPRPPPIVEEAPEEGDDPNFVSDTNNLITIKQNGPALREIRDTDMGAAITYLLLDLEGVDTEPDILDDGRKGPWTIFATADCEEQFKAKYGDKIVLTFSEIPIEFTITYGEIQTKKGGEATSPSLNFGVKHSKLYTHSHSLKPPYRRTECYPNPNRFGTIDTIIHHRRYPRSSEIDGNPSKSPSCIKKKILRRKRYTLAATLRDT